MSSLLVQFGRVPRSVIRVLQLPGFYYNNIHSKSLLQSLFHPQQLGVRHDNSPLYGRLTITILEVSNKNT